MSESKSDEPRDWFTAVFTAIGVIGVIAVIIASAYRLSQPSEHDVMRAACDRGMGQWVEGSRDYYCVYPSGGGR